MFVEVTGEYWYEGIFWSPILNRVKISLYNQKGVLMGLF